MYVGLTEEHQKLRDDLRTYYEGIITPEAEVILAKSEGIGELPRKITLQMAKDGWLGIGWPKNTAAKGVRRSSSTSSLTSRCVHRPRSRC